MSAPVTSSRDDNELAKILRKLALLEFLLAAYKIVEEEDSPPDSLPPLFNPQ